MSDSFRFHALMKVAERQELKKTASSRTLANHRDTFGSVRLGDGARVDDVTHLAPSGSSPAFEGNRRPVPHPASQAAALLAAGDRRFSRHQADFPIDYLHTRTGSSSQCRNSRFLKPRARQ